MQFQNRSIWLYIEKNVISEFAKKSYNFEIGFLFIVKFVKFCFFIKNVSF